MESLEQFFRWEQATRDTIDVKKIYVDMADDLVAGVLLSQIVFWFLPNQEGKTKLRVKKDDHLWLVKSREDWWDECRIKPRQYDTAFKKLEEKELVTKKTMKFNGDPMTHIRIVWDKFLPCLYEELTKIRTKLNVKPLSPNGEYHDKSGFNESVKTKLHDQTTENTGFNELVKTNSQNRDFVLYESVKTLTEITTEKKKDDDDEDIKGKPTFFQQEFIAEAHDRHVPEEEIQDTLKELKDTAYQLQALDITFEKVIPKYEKGEVSKFSSYFVSVLKREQRRLNYVQNQAKLPQPEKKDFPFYNWLENE